MPMAVKIARTIVAGETLHLMLPESEVALTD
jgi:hypothetical protein